MAKHFEILEKTNRPKKLELLEKLKPDFISRCREFPEFFIFDGLDENFKTNFEESATKISEDIKKFTVKAGMEKTSGLRNKVSKMLQYVVECEDHELVALSKVIEDKIVGPAYRQMSCEEESDVEIYSDEEGDKKELNKKLADPISPKPIGGTTQQGERESQAKDSPTDSESIIQPKFGKRPKAFSTDSDSDRK